MNEDAEFVRAVRERPDDVTLRLVYADWLDERNDPRGEYLRLRLQLAELTKRLTQLGEQIDPAWLAAMRGPSGRAAELSLHSGRSVRFLSLDQWDVYAGLLEGLPTREGNQRRIERILARERERNGGDVYLVRPEERPIAYHREEPYPFGTPAALPGIGCVGRLHSNTPARDPGRGYSGLTVVWFQDEFAFPIDPVVREQIRAIDWEQHATDFDW
jgi:uncharacterized protein (TIGR02996 family)